MDPKPHQVVTEDPPEHDPDRRQPHRVARSDQADEHEAAVVGGDSGHRREPGTDAAACKQVIVGSACLAAGSICPDQSESNQEGKEAEDYRIDHARVNGWLADADRLL